MCTEKTTSKRRFKFDKSIENWETITEEALHGMEGTLHLIDEETGEFVEAEILFLYSTLRYTGYVCAGIARIGNCIGYISVEHTSREEVYFIENNNLANADYYNEQIKLIVEDLDDDCRYSEAIHVYDCGDMKRLVKQYHAMQKRNNNPEIPYTEHLFGVASILKTIAECRKEVPEDILKLMTQAALGHDLLEDTAINEDTIGRSTHYNRKILRWILELTNPNDDAHTDEYMEKIASASEEARLIKYADLIENTSSFCYSLHEPYVENPVQRAKEFYVPILNRTTDVLAKTSFEKYPKTAESMRITLKIYTDLLLTRTGLLDE